jgi:GrpB-like predicted nucleotidyltransferase (UPF0157 family)
MGRIIDTVARLEELKMQNLNPIVVVEYRPEWPEEFMVIARRLQEALGDLALR